MSGSVAFKGNPTMPSYIAVHVDLDSLTTPKNKADYEKRTEEIIGNTVQRITDTVEESADLQQFFHVLLADLGKARGALAAKHNTPGAEDFGKRRDVVPFEGHIYTTILVNSAAYDRYNKRTLEFFQRYLSQMKHNLQNFQQKKDEITESHLGVVSKLEIEVLDGNDMVKRRWNAEATIPEIQAIRKRAIQEINRNTSAYETGNEDQLLKATFKAIKKTNPTYYKRERIIECMKLIRAGFPSPRKVGHDKYEGNTAHLKSHYVHVIARQEVNGKLYAFTEYFTWMYFTYSHDPVERMVNCSKVVLLHHDLFLIEDVLNDVARLFERAIQWKGIDMNELKNRVGLFRYEFAHVIPFERGSAAVGEWLECAIYRYHGFEFEVRKNVDLEAFSTPLLSQFMQKYHDMTDPFMIVD